MSDKDPLINKPKKTRQTIIVLLLMALIIAALGLRIYYSSLALSIKGPVQMDVHHGRVALVHNNQFYMLDERGNVTLFVPLENFGIINGVLDMRLVHGEVWFLDADSHELISCGLNRLNCQNVSENLHKWLSGYARFYAHVTSSSVYLVDAEQHRLLEYDPFSQEVKVLLDKQVLNRPLAIQKYESTIWIADSRHREIKTYDNMSFEVDTPAVDITHIPELYRWPVDLVVEKHSQYVLLEKKKSYESILVQFTGEVAIHIPVPQAEILERIALLDDQILVTDSKAFTIWAIDKNTHKLTQFGSKELQSVFATDKALADEYNIASTVSLWAVVVFAGIALVYGLAASGLKRKTEKQDFYAQQSMPDFVTGEIYWSEPNRKLRLLFYSLFLIIVMFMIALFIVVVQLFSGVAEEEISRFEIVYYDLSWMIVSFIAIVLLNMVPNLHLYLGTDGQYFYFRLFGKETKVAAEDIMYSRHYIVSGRLSFALSNAAGAFFINKKIFMQYILPVLQRKAQQVTLQKIMWHSLRHMSTRNIINTVLITALLIYMVVRFKEKLFCLSCIA